MRYARTTVEFYCHSCTTPNRCKSIVWHVPGPLCKGKADGPDDCDCLNLCGDDPWLKTGKSIPSPDCTMTLRRANLVPAKPTPIRLTSQTRMFLCRVCQCDFAAYPGMPRFAQSPLSYCQQHRPKE